ncbi:MAG: response regulator [Campylobacterota bacterium]|nr:response regulator [Campylobacterota bacterium]
MSIKILGVDDSPTIRRLLKISTKQYVEDVEFLEAENGQIALDILEHHPDVKLIFLDVNMPIIGGKEFLENLRFQDRFSNIKVIVQTTQTDKAMAKSLVELGISGYIVKPYTIETLQKLLTKLSEQLDIKLK